MGCAISVQVVLGCLKKAKGTSREQQSSTATASVPALGSRLEFRPHFSSWWLQAARGKPFPFEGAFGHSVYHDRNHTRTRSFIHSSNAGYLGWFWYLGYSFSIFINFFIYFIFWPQFHFPLVLTFLVSLPYTSLFLSKRTGLPWVPIKHGISSCGRASCLFHFLWICTQ